MRILRTASLLLLLAIAGCAAHDDYDFDTCGVRPRYTLPVSLSSGVPTVQGSVGGKPVNLVLDTGATNINLTESAARRLGLGTDQRNVMTSQGVGGSVRSFAGQLRDFRIGGMEVPNHQVQLVPDFNRGGVGPAFDGLFGVSVLSIFEVELNLRQQAVTLYAGRLCPQTVVPPWNFGYSTINAEASERGRFLIPVELDGHRLMALLDTGAASTLVARDTALALGISEAALSSGPQTALRGVGTAAPSAAMVRFKQLRVGDETFPTPNLLVSPRLGGNIDIVLGANFLGNRRVWLSYARKRVFVEYTIPPTAQ